MLAVALWEGNFGDGMDVLMICSALSLFRVGNVHHVVALKNLLTEFPSGMAALALTIEEALN